MGVKASKIDNLPQIFLYAIFAWFLKPLLGITVEGKEKISAKKPVLIVANHRSKLDPFIILSAMGWKNFLKFYPWRFPLAKSLAEKWWIKWPSWYIGCYQITGRGDLDKSLEETFKAIDKGYSIIFFPQGKMILKDEISKTKRGIGHICLKRDIYLLPVKIDHVGFTRRTKRGKITRSNITFGDMIESRFIRENNDPEELHEVVMNNINETNLSQVITSLNPTRQNHSLEIQAK
jgi:1-acyl-sn-glycerol-3-phosphate acyltransferase